MVLGDTEAMVLPDTEAMAFGVTEPWYCEIPKP